VPLSKLLSQPKYRVTICDKIYVPSPGRFGLEKDTMEISPEEAQLLLAKWKNDAASIILFARLPGARFVLSGEIFHLKTDEIRFMCGTGSQVAIDISSVEFEYMDPREEEAATPPGEVPTYHCFLYLTTSNHQVSYALFEPTDDHMKNYFC
jgi:hypothetical protein